MADLNQYRTSIDEIVKRAAEEQQKEKARQEERAKKFEDMLLEFDRHADALQDEVIAPRIKYLASLFPHAQPPVMREEKEYRHRIVLRFKHVPEYPCTVDIVILIVHCNAVEFLKVKFEYTILPAYVTDRYKYTDEIQVAMDKNSYSSVGDFIQTCIETFLTGYLKIRCPS